MTETLPPMPQQVLDALARSREAVEAGRGKACLGPCGSVAYVPEDAYPILYNGICWGWQRYA